MTTTAETVVEAYGWELHYTGGGSDKFYRVIVSGTVCAINYGRRGSVGNWSIKVFNSTGQAIDKARIQTDEKSAKGYRLTRDFTTFEVPEAAWQQITEMRNSAADRHKLAVARSFKTAAAAAGTELTGADR